MRLCCSAAPRQHQSRRSPPVPTLELRRAATTRRACRAGASNEIVVEHFVDLDVLELEVLRDPNLPGERAARREEALARPRCAIEPDKPRHGNAVARDLHVFASLG